ncbi:MAG: hypothetical protein PUE95_03930 [Lachnospiraceae bacterium]|nr:hypothetical protein [Lachnospiraceae bacterium]
MTRKCNFCGGALKYDAELRMMVCEYCLGMVPVEETDEEKELAKNDDHSQNDDFIECEIYTCKSCGAELVINDVEAATYCAYCGQPTIVFNRIAKRRRPKYIIPFSITKNYAIANIREKFIQGKYVPDEIKYFNPDLLRGIYIPFLLYDIRYKDKQLIQGQYTEKESNDSSTMICFREAVATYKNIPVDASDRLSNESSERLEPFYDRDMTDFKVEYLSGFYADLMDSKTDQLKTIAASRAKEMFWEQMQKNVALDQCTLLKSSPKYAIEKEQYVLFPVWFMIFHEGNREYTILVNGQTGKVVGALPPSRLKTLKAAIIMGILLSVLGALALPRIACFDAEMQGWVNNFLLFGIPALLAGGLRNLQSLKKSLHLTTEKTVRDFVTERQDG